ncbi:CCE_0567 family metalloprotein [Sinorhizobium medicae]|uniref:CCE_0567 family metalloprotein n=1 Tax=Sinorhizobium medicae TaxID=110321 RepID=UPI001295098D|nr:CCE_0567 family metalloprotein [Sinorhizobium medicae]MQX79070.1 hypothetical protein [Sinorhizobium medicae]
MSDLEELRKRMRKLQSRAGTAMMELHDLAEDLPSKWTEIRAGSVCLNSFGRFAKWISATDYAAAIIGVSALK